MIPTHDFLRNGALEVRGTVRDADGTTSARFMSDRRKAVIILRCQRQRRLFVVVRQDTGTVPIHRPQGGPGTRRPLHTQCDEREA